MAEYWKSLPRKFCDICKCWFADNKASIDFHERGKRHKENAQKRIQDIQKRGIKEFKKQQELENEMEKIERAALAAYQKDLQNMQGGDKSSTVSLPTNEHLNNVPEPIKPNKPVKPKSSVKKVQQKKEVPIKKEVVSETEPTPLQTLWYEAATEDGCYTYYWNAETSESRWEPPEEGFITLEEQSQLNPETATGEQQPISNLEENIEIKEEPPEECVKVKEEPPAENIEVQEEPPAENMEVKEEPPEESIEVKEEKVDSEDEDEDVPCSMGPQPKVDPYGQWITVEKPKPVKYDLQLPKPSENVVEVVIPVHKDTSFKIKEKVIGHLSDSDCANVTFKKRKFTGSLKRNARQRTADDD